MAADIDKRGPQAEANAEHQEEWAAMNPRPEWDDPAHWATARPKEAE